MYFIDLKIPSRHRPRYQYFVALNEKGDLRNAVLYEL